MKTLSGKMVKARDERVERAIMAGSITPALRDFCITLANADEGLLEEFYAKIGTPFVHLRQSPIMAEMEKCVNLERALSGNQMVLNSDKHRLADMLCIDVGKLA